MNSPVLDTPLLPDSEGQIPESRVRNGWHAHAIYRRLDWYDSRSEMQRANIDFMIDGGKPYSEEALREAGRGEDANVNFMEAKLEDDTAQCPFIEMTTVADRLWNVKSSYGDESTRQRNSNIISEEFTATVRDWGEDFDYQRLRLAQQFTRHGPAYLYWEDEFDWRWRADGPTAFKVSRNTESRSSAIDYCICKRSMKVNELYKYIRNEEAARQVGRWNVDAVKRALWMASYDTGRPWSDYSWEDFVAEAKENDIEFGSRGQEVRVFHLWVREFDGRMSHYIGLQSGVVLENSVGDQKENIFYKSAADFNISEDPDTGEVKVSSLTENDKPDEREMPLCGNGFLYAHRFRFPKFDSCIIPFFYSIGTHGTIHTIRAQGELNFAPIAIANRTMCRLIDCAGASSMITLKTASASDAETLSYRQMGPFLIMGGTGEVVANAMPDVAGRLEPVLDRMSNYRRQLSPNSSAANPVDKSKQPQTKAQVQNNQVKDSMLSSAILTQFYGPWGRLGKEMFRRMNRKNMSEREPGAREAFEFQARCILRGVPKEALDPDLCTVTAVRVIGNGSPQVRQAATERVLEMSENFDPKGKWKAEVDALAAIPGLDWEQATAYRGPEPGRTTEQDTLANLENGLFQLGKKQPVEPDQDHWVHCQHHEQLVSQYVEAFDDGKIQGSELVPVLDAALDNMLHHSDYLSKNKSRQKEAAEVRAFIQQNNGILEQQQQKLIAAMHRQKEQQSGGQNGQQPNGDEQRKAELHQQSLSAKQQEIQQKQQEFELDQAIRMQKLQQQDKDSAQIRAIRDLEAARKTAFES